MTSWDIVALALFIVIALALIVVLVRLIGTRRRLDGNEDAEGWAQAEHAEDVRARSVSDTRQLMEEIDRLGRGGR